MKSCKITYKRTGGKRERQFEKELDALMERYSMKRWASGCDIDTQIRDIAYEQKESDQNPPAKYTA